MPRIHRSRRQIPVPPNDAKNFFFANENCGRYTPYGYNDNPNYTN